MEMDQLITDVVFAKAALGQYILDEIERVAIKCGYDSIEMIPDPHYKHLIIKKAGNDTSNQRINDMFDLWLNHIERLGLSHNWNRRDGWNWKGI